MSSDGRNAGSGSPNSAESAAERSRSSAGGQGPELSPEVEGVDGGKLGAAAAGGSAGVAEPIYFMELEKKPLLKVFVFLNAGEVLRAAQVCRPFFRKVRLSLEYIYILIE